MVKNTPSSPVPDTRLAAIDFTKGALVGFMVLYHALNYSTELQLGFKYVGFLPPSFIFITGFLMAMVYFPRPPERDAATGGRMVVRGLKLLILFTVLNIAGTLVSSRNYNGQPLGLKLFFSHWEDIYFNGAGNMAAFEVLLPIAYLLLLGPLLLLLRRAGRWAVPVLAALVIVTLSVLEFEWGIPANAAMMAAGLLGAALGRIPQTRLRALGRVWFVPLALYAGLFLLANGSMSESFLLQLAAGVLAIAALYGIGERVRKPEWLMRHISVLGSYSLLAYIVQIGFLQVLVRRLGRPDPDSVDFLLFFGATLLVTAVAAELARWVRSRSRIADQAYRLVFA
jgi:peptidoglycan/LPS O-acetylase OafA/YrhL